MKFPKDADGQVLNMLYKQGIDFNKKHIVDFFITIPDQGNGEKIISRLQEQGLNCELDYNEEFEDCTCSKEMYLVYEDIVEMQKELSTLSEEFGGYTDGWGTFV
ncbi:ribonuclease E inhibitor RraB [Bacillus wiedmannii]|uniref:ribonuclease E inhibitor RraB n=1 Tax=Bacillus wiedmannii TaxID=1890302 RepID=UPI0011451519|nr:ribonuclease E inhibitor RraB [Bacillus wiedmannii]MCU5706190.1 ribonuclease E inhibitor RraB [Bacillus wiedmannii]